VLVFKWTAERLRFGNNTMEQVPLLARHRGLTLVILATWEAEIRWNAVQQQPRGNSSRDPIYLHNNWSKMNWRWASSSKAPALQVRSPEFKLQSHQKLNWHDRPQ
jgi:hypothetical protein